MKHNTDQYLTTMAAYNQWANAELIAAVRSLPQGAATTERKSLFKTILNTLNHPLVTDRIWWAHMHGTQHDHKALNEVIHNELEPLAQERAKMDQRLIDYVAGLAPAAAEEEIEFTLLSGVPGRMTRWQMLMHIFNHNTYHRGFVVETFCQIPAPLPLIDLPIFLRGGGGLRMMPQHLAADAPEAAE